MFAAIVLVCLALFSAQAQDATTIANYIESRASNFFQVSELVSIEKALANQVCGGASIEQIFDNFVNTVSQNIGGMTATKAMALVSKLQTDLGNDFTAVRDACATAAANVYGAAYNDVSQYCSSGIGAVLAEANNYANDQWG
ncbi:hypothetical protein QR680_016113 [Steinernema hermaphroditum]|uniref:Uncharacterized protein n=1 Tax=Steinernema hermaphroditum TaxID=289476 RepID=A0AA39HC07_9BILA|nr:hypothetical protein QR680_016113 [Steinernema hermaphroditum]